MSLSQGFPNTFSATQQTQEVLKNTDNETKKIYTDINTLMSAGGHAHTGTGSDGAKIDYNDLSHKPTTIPTADNCTGNSSTATKLQTARKINGVAFDGSEDIAIAVSSGQVGVVDNIVNGLTVTAGTGLQAVAGTGRAIINETVVSFADPSTIALEPRMASLVYAKGDGSVGKVNAVLPTVSTQTLRYVLDGSPTISSTGSVANLATKTGAVNSTDGRIGYSGKGDGTTGYYTCTSNSGVPAYTSASTRILIIDNFVSNGATQVFYNDSITSFGCTAANNLTVNGVDTSFTLTAGSAYVIALPADASTTTATVYVNGVGVNTGAYITNATAVAPTFYSGASGASKSPSQIAYFEYYASKLTSTQIAQISNNLLLPCQYIDNGVTKDIRSVLPANSVSLGYVKTNSTAVVEIDTKKRKYGRIEGATGGNRRADIEWKYVTVGIIKDFDNPFGTENVTVSEIWFKKNLTDSKHSVIDGFYYAGFQGCFTRTVNAFNITIQTGDSYIISSYNSPTGVAETSGYIAVIAEVVE